jgi:hypothetical protein
MSNHIKEIPMCIKTGVSKAVELGRKALATVMASPSAAAIGGVIGFLAGQVLRVIF